MKLNAQKGNVITALLIGIVFAGLTGLSFWYFYSSSKNPSSNETTESPINAISSINPQPTESTNSQEKQIYTSKNLKISFQVPKDYSAEEKFNDIILTNNNNIITISSHGSFYNTALEHVNELEKKNKSNFIEKTLYEGNPTYTFLKTSKVDSNYENKIRVTYFGVSDYKVVLIYSSDSETNSELEKIVNSIKFI